MFFFLWIKKKKRCVFFTQNINFLECFNFLAMQSFQINRFALSTDKDRSRKEKRKRQTMKGGVHIIKDGKEQTRKTGDKESEG